MGPVVASLTVGSVPLPTLPWVTLGRPATPSLLWASAPPLQQKELEEVASRSLQALRCQDFLPQWMGSQETETPRLVLSGVEMRLEKCAGGHWLQAQQRPNAWLGSPQEGFSWELKVPTPRSPL